MRAQYPAKSAHLPYACHQQCTGHSVACLLSGDHKVENVQQHMTLKLLLQATTMETTVQTSCGLP